MAASVGTGLNSFRIWQYRLSRLLGRTVTRIAAIITRGAMPPFVSTSAVVVRDGSILVVHDPIRDEPVLPGGHLKWSETPEHALVREVEEETGFRVRIDDLLGVFSGPLWAGEGGVVRIVYTATIDGGTLRSSPEGRAHWRSADEFRISETRDAGLLREWLIRRNTDMA